MLLLKLDELYIQVSIAEVLRLSSLQDFFSNHYKFFLSEAFLGQYFEGMELDCKEPEPKDLFLLRLMSPTRCRCRAHVDVHRGHREIIHLEGKILSGHHLHRFLGPCKGTIS